MKNRNNHMNRRKERQKPDHKWEHFDGHDNWHCGRYHPCNVRMSSSQKRNAKTEKEVGNNSTNEHTSSWNEMKSKRVPKGDPREMVIVRAESKPCSAVSPAASCTANETRSTTATHSTLLDSAQTVPEDTSPPSLPSPFKPESAFLHCGSRCSRCVEPTRCQCEHQCQCGCQCQC